MTIFTGLSDIILFFLLFVLIYALNDSIVSQIILFAFTAYSSGIFVSSVMGGTQSDAQFALFFGALMIYAGGNILFIVAENKNSSGTWWHA